MTEPDRDLSLAQARSLIDSYAFDLGRDDAEKLLKHWLNLYSASWIKLATIEALYLGRYKAVSIEQIMGVWLRRGTPNPHFNYEFERLICRKLPKHLSDVSNFKGNRALKDISKSSAAPTSSRQKACSHVSQATHCFTATDEASDRVNKTAKADPSASEAKPELVNIAETEADVVNLEKAFKKSDRNLEDNNISLISALGLSYKSNWSEFTEGSKMIHQFIPLPDVSSFFNKLKTFGEQGLESQ